MGSEGKLEEQLEQQQQEGKQFEEGKQLDDEKQLHKKKTRKPPLTRRKTENLNHVTRFIDMEEAVEKLVQQSIISTLNGKLFEVRENFHMRDLNLIQIVLESATNC